MTQQLASAVWDSRIADLFTEVLNCHDLVVKQFLWDAACSVQKAAPWAVWGGVDAVKATHFPEVSFAHPLWKEVSSHDNIPFTGEIGEWVSVTTPTFFGEVSLKAGDRFRIVYDPSPEFSDRPRTYQIAIK